MTTMIVVVVLLMVMIMLVHDGYFCLAVDQVEQETLDEQYSMFGGGRNLM